MHENEILLFREKYKIIFGICNLIFNIKMPINHI